MLPYLARFHAVPGRILGTGKILLIVVLVWTIQFPKRLHAQAKTAKAKQSQTVADEVVQKSIKDLDAKDYNARKMAAETLQKKGPKIARSLIAHVMDAKSSFEARTRCLKILESWSQSGKESDIQGIAKIVASYPVQDFPDSNELKLLREYFVLDLSNNQKIVLQALQDGGMTFRDNVGGQAHLTVTHWKGKERELGYLRKIKSPFELSATPEFLNANHSFLRSSKISSLHVVRPPSQTKFRRGPIENHVIDDLAMKTIGKLSGLKSLSLSWVTVSEKGYQHLGACNDLEKLVLSKNIADHHLGFLPKLQNLKELEFHNAFQMKGPGLKQVGQLKQLEKLEIFYTNIAGKHLSHLAELKQLKHLYAPQTKMNDEGMKQIAKLASLEELILDNTHATNRGLSMIKHLPNLRSIDLVSGSFSNQGVMELLSLPKLKSVRVSAGMITSKVQTMLANSKAEFKLTGQFFQPNSDEEYKAIERLLAAGVQVNQYAKPNNLTMMLYPGCWNGMASEIQQIAKLMAIKHLRLYIYGELPDNVVEEIIELDPKLEIRLFSDPEKEAKSLPDHWVEKLKIRFPKFSS